MTDFARSRLSDRKLAPAASNLVLAEWSAPGQPPGPPQYQAPLHIHHHDDEAWYVLEGRLAVQIGDDRYEVPAGGAVIGPHGVAHTFWNPDPAPVRYVIVMSAQTSALLDALHSAGGLTPEQSRQLFADYGCELIG